MGTLHPLRRHQAATPTDLPEQVRSARLHAATDLQRADPARLPRLVHWTPSTVEAHALGFLHGQAHGHRCGTSAGRWQGAAIVVGLLAAAAAGGALLGLLVGLVDMVPALLGA